jgi:hypothetical protein
MAQRARDRGLDVRIGSVCDLPFEDVTPFAAVHRIPWVGRGLCRAELLAGHSPLRYLGGFLIAVLRKA